jgi:hypothetical protein
MLGSNNPAAGGTAEWPLLAAVDAKAPRPPPARRLDDDNIIAGRAARGARAAHEEDDEVKGRRARVSDALADAEAARAGGGGAGTPKEPWFGAETWTPAGAGAPTPRGVSIGWSGLARVLST